MKLFLTFFSAVLRNKQLVENIGMECGANMLHGFGALLFWDVRIGQGHGVIIFLVVHGGLGSCNDARVEHLVFEDSNPRMYI